MRTLLLTSLASFALIAASCADEGPCDPDEIAGWECCDGDNVVGFECRPEGWTCAADRVSTEDASWRCTAIVPPLEERCLVDALEEAPSRVALGATIWLAAIAPECAAELRWVLVDAPVDAEVAVDGQAYGTVLASAIGTWRFRLEGAESEVLREVEVVPASDLSFQNYNYYPGQSLARVGDEVWVAAVYAPAIVRLDATSLVEVGRVQTGAWPVAVAWRDGMDVALVAQRAEDTLGFVDVASGALVHSLWVGDEPANVVVSADGSRAWVALATERAVAEVDVAARQVTRRIEGIFDPLAMALTADGARLLVASHRSSMAQRSPYADQPAADDDIAVVDLASGAVVEWWGPVGSTINALLVGPDRVYVATTRSTPTLGLGDVGEPTFAHAVVALDPETGAELLAADLSRQASSGGFAVTAHGLALAGGSLWVAVEGSDLVVQLDPETLEEQGRFQAEGRPRALLADGDGVVAHGAQAFAVTRVLAGAEPTQASYAGDPRPADLALGQRTFTGAGDSYGANHACNSCHLDGLTDGNVWRTGPFDVWSVARPLFWLDATEPLGWEGHVSNVRVFAVAAGTSIGKNPTTEEALALTSYLRSLVPPPAGNGRTGRDGQPTSAAALGRSLFDGSAGCAACHVGRLATSRELLPAGVTEGPTDVPSLMASYRHGYWLKTGDARGTEEAVRAMVEWTGVTLTDSQVGILTAYVEQMTARKAHVITSEPRFGATGVATDAPIEIVLSHPVWDDPTNAQTFVLKDAAGEPVEAVVEVSGRRVVLVPGEPLTPGASYEVAAGWGLMEDKREVPLGWLTSFETAAAPAFALGGDYEVVVDFPAIDVANGRLAPSKIMEVRVPASVAPTAHGGTATLTMAEDLVSAVPWVVDGETLRMPAFPIPLGGPAFANGWPASGALSDADGDGVADTASGELEVSGPGFREKGVAWRLERPKAPVEGSE